MAERSRRAIAVVALLAATATFGACSSDDDQGTPGPAREGVGGDGSDDATTGGSTGGGSTGGDTTTTDRPADEDSGSRATGGTGSNQGTANPGQPSGG